MNKDLYRWLSVSILAAWAWAPHGTWAQTSWTPIDTKPRPNAVIALDESVTMMIDDNGCNSCHENGLAFEDTRLAIAADQIQLAFEDFRDYFIFGGFRYQGCNAPSIEGRAVHNDADPEASYQNLMNLVESADLCDERENFWPNGATPNVCLTHGGGPGCVNDRLLLEDVMDELEDDTFPGIDLDEEPVGTSTDCYRAGATQPYVDLFDRFPEIAQGQNWLTWSDPSLISVGEANAGFCEPLYNTLVQLRTELNTCLNAPEEFWDLSGITQAGICDPAVVAATLCSGSPFDRPNSCVCNPNPSCFNVGAPNSACGVTYGSPSRQQMAMCEMYDDTGPFGLYMIGQGDNRASGGCRENVGIFFSDGHGGNTAAFRTEAFNAYDQFYSSISGASNLFLLYISNAYQFDNSARAMMGALQQVPGGMDPFEAANLEDLQRSMSKVLNRAYAGTYTGAPAGLNDLGDALAVVGFTVPNEVGGTCPSPTAAPGGVCAAGDDYSGFPMRVSVYELDEDGAVVGRAWDSDEAGRVANMPGCFTELGGTDVDALGPWGTFALGHPRTVDINPNTMERDGDTSTADGHGALRWGDMFGFAASRPVFVGLPRDIVDSDLMGAYEAHRVNVGDRPQVIYTMGGGYVHGLHAGTAQGGFATFGNRRLSNPYDLGGAQGGRRVLRYKPHASLLEAPNAGYNYELNSLVAQKMMTGQLVVREVPLWNTVTSDWEFKTLLLGNQGDKGVGFFALDVTDPCNPERFSEWILPAPPVVGGPCTLDRDCRAAPHGTGSGAPTDICNAAGQCTSHVVPNASSVPEVYMVQDTGIAAGRRPSMVLTGGKGGTSTLYVVPLEENLGAPRNLAMYETALPAVPDESYAAQPVCLDATGEGYITQCYAVRTDGHIFRIRFVNGNPQPAEDVTPASVEAGRVFTTAPAVFFGADGAVNIVYGSGNPDILAADGINHIYKFVDETNRSTTPAFGDPLTSDASVCLPASTFVDGKFELRPNERLISPPIVASGVVAFSTYETVSDRCSTGNTWLYAMDFKTCTDVLVANGTGGAPEPINVGEGISTSPVLHRASGRLFAGTSATVSGETMTSAEVEGLTGNDARGIAQALYWRPILDLP